MKKQNIAIAMLLIAICISAVYPLNAQLTDTSAISLSGDNWSLKVDSILQTSIDSKSIPYTSTTVKGEKELFLTLQSLEDCKAGIVQFKVQTSGLTVYKQLPLDQEIQLKEGEYDFVNSTHAMLKDTVKVYRPENVVNSFACFNSEGMKVLHIYASKLIDAGGQSVWVDSDLKDGLLTVYLNSKFLETAKFPVTLDPTFGYTSIGGTEANDYHAYTSVCKFNLTEKAVFSQISFYGRRSADAGLQNVGIYDTSGGVANTLKASGTAKQISTTPSWTNFTIDVTLDVGYYWLAWASEDGTDIYYYYDSGETNQTHLYGDGFMPNPYVLGGDGTDVNQIVSIYADYTVYVEPTPTPTPTPTDEPTTTPTPTEFTSTETWNIIILLVMLIVGLILALKRTLPILNFVFGMFTIAISAWTLTVAPYFGGLLQFSVIVTGIILMYLGYKEAY